MQRLEHVRDDARDERGSTLMMVLLTIIVVAIVFSSVLGYENTTLKAQTVLATKRSLDLSADSAIDMMISKMRQETAVGVYTPNNNCKNLTQSQLTYDDPQVASNDIVVKCVAFADSGTPGGNLGQYADQVILAYGGVSGDGDDNGDIAPNKRFCDDNERAACEPGIFVGQNTGSAGLLIAGNGGQGATDPLVRSNGSIVASSLLNVEGPVRARRACVNVMTGYVPGGSAGTAPDNSQCLGANSSGTNFEMDPAWHHQWWPLVEAVRDTRGKASIADPPVRRWNQWDPNDTNRTGMPAMNTDTSVPFNAVDDPNGAQLTAIKNLCADHFVHFVPGWYRDLQALNVLMHECDDTVFWFDPKDPSGAPGPGRYYFDFTDVNSTDGQGQKFWMAPVDFAQIVGGAPNGRWYPLDDTVHCAAVPCVQPIKSLVSKKLAPTNGPWVATGTSADPAGAGTVMNDGAIAEATLNAASPGDADATIGGNTAKLKVPLNANDVINLASTDGVHVRIKEQHTKPDTGAGTLYKPGYPRLHVEIDGTGTSNCELPLDGSVGTYVPNASDPNRYLDVDLTNGCPAGNVGSGSNFPSGAGWTVAKVNLLQAKYDVQRLPWVTGFTPSVIADLDGIEFRVGYKGPPSPQYPAGGIPGGCDPTQDGVQWIFGDLSRIRFDASNFDAYVELCGSAGPNSLDPDHHAIAIYGLAGPHYNVADPAAALGACPTIAVPVPPGSNCISDTPPARRQLTSEADDLGQIRSTVTSSGTFLGVGPTGSIPSDTNGADAWERIGDTKNLYMKIYNAQGDVTYRVGRVPDYVGHPNYREWLPPGSTIESVKLRIRHAEPPYVGSSGSPPTPTDGGTITSMNAVVDTSVGTDPSDPDGAGSQITLPMPAYTNITGPGCPTSQDLIDNENGVANTWPSACMTEFTYGNTPQEEAHLTEALRTPQGLNHLSIKITPAGSGSHKVVIIDGIELEVRYRPPGSLRPLRGCATIRTVDHETTSIPGGTSAVSPMFRGTSFIHNGNWQGNEWLSANASDESYDNGGNIDTANCPLLRFESKTNDVGAKIHVTGDIYAPTAALDFSGKANDAPFVSDGIVARQLTAWRWTDAAEIPAFGCCASSTRSPRHVTLEARAGGPTGQLIASAEVYVYDGTQQSPARTVRISSWKRGP